MLRFEETDEEIADALRLAERPLGALSFLVGAPRLPGDRSRPGQHQERRRRRERDRHAMARHELTCHVPPRRHPRLDRPLRKVALKVGSKIGGRGITAERVLLEGAQANRVEIGRGSSRQTCLAGPVPKGRATFASQIRRSACAGVRSRTEYGRWPVSSSKSRIPSM